MDQKIIISPNVLFGKPHIKGTRIPVEQVLACLAEGWTHKKIIKEFDLTEENIKACIDFAHQAVSRTHFLNTSGKVHA